jgi:hypothetical protein
LMSRLGIVCWVAGGEFGRCPHPAKLQISNARMGRCIARITAVVSGFKIYLPTIVAVPPIAVPMKLKTSAIGLAMALVLLPA